MTDPRPFDPYLPADLRRDAAAWIARGLPHAEATPGAVLFADVSGFTAMSEQLLAKLGRTGAEVLTSVLNGYFERMVAALEPRGGTVQKFGGDALTVLFAGDPVEATLRAVEAAREMQGAMDRFAAIPTAAGTFALAMKIGIDAGPCRRIVFGDPGRRLDYVVEGGPVDGSADAEHHASAGEIVLSPRAAALVPGPLEPREGGFAALGASPPRRGTRLGPSPLPAPDAAPPLPRPEDFFPVPLRSRIASGDAMLLNEHRRVALVFLKFPNADYGDAAALERLQRFFLDAERVATLYGGIVAKVDFGDKGSKLLLVFGAPEAVEQAAEMAVRAALDLADAARATVGEAAIGVNAGAVFAGDVGAALRREYTVMGDAVNLSARLMQAAGAGRILASEAVFGEADEFDWDEIEPFAVKGKSARVRAAIPGRRRGAPAVAASRDEADAPVLHRPQVEAPLDAALERLAADPPSGGIVRLLSPAGSGKGLLLHRLADRATARGVAVDRLRLRPFDAAVPFGIGRTLLPAWLGLPVDAPAGRLEVRLRMALAGGEGFADSDLDSLLELLGLRAGRGRGRAESAEEVQGRVGLFGRALFRLAGDGRRLILLDGAEHLDSVSADILAAARPAEVPWLVVAAARVPPPLEGETVEIPPLSPDETASLVALRLADDRIDPKLAAFIQGRSGGNPLYVVTLVDQLRESGAAAYDPVRQLWALDEARLAAGRFDSLEALLLRRLDSLPERPRRLAKAASTAGDRFPSDLLGLLEPKLDPSAIVEGLRELLEAGLLEEQGSFLLFPDPLLREAIYGTVPASERTRFHRRAARALDRGHRALVAERADAWLGAGDDARAIPLLLRAARDENRALLFRAALARLEQLRDAAARLPHPLPPRLEEARREGVRLDAGVRLLTGDALEASRDRLAAEADAAADAGATDHRLAVLDLLGQTTTRLGRFDETAEQADRLVALAGDDAGRARWRGLGLLLRGGARARQGRFDGAEADLTEAIRLLERVRDRAALGRALQSYGLTLYYLGRPKEALLAFSRAVKLARARGSRTDTAKALINRALAEEELGRRKAAAATLAGAVEMLTAAGASSLLAYAYGNLNVLALSTGDLSAAARWSNLQVKCFEHLGSFDEAAMAASCLVVVETLRGDADGLRRTLRDFRSDESGLRGDAFVRVDIALSAIHGLCDLGSREEAAALGRSVAASLRETPEFERGNVLSAVVRFLEDGDRSGLSALDPAELTSRGDKLLALCARGSSMENFIGLARAASASGDWLTALEAWTVIAVTDRARRPSAVRSIRKIAGTIGSDFWSVRSDRIGRGAELQPAPLPVDIFSAVAGERPYSTL